jgi:adenylate cyclase
MLMRIREASLFLRLDVSATGNPEQRRYDARSAQIRTANGSGLGARPLPAIEPCCELTHSPRRDGHAKGWIGLDGIEVMSAPDIQPPHRQLSAILFADVHGYARLMSTAEEQTYERVTRSIRLIKSLIGDYGGNVVQTSGDGVLALFESASQALRFALAIQREFRNDAVWNPDGEAIAFRIGINLGEVIVGEGNVHGHSVNVAARIQALAQPGGICISEGVRRAVRDTLGVEIRPLGPQILKNIAEPVEVFAIDVDGPQITPSAPPLPEQLETFGPPEEASVVVLPLDNMSGEPSDSHLCDGITRDIITNLSRFRDLLVIAPHSAFLFKRLDLSAQEMMRRLGVRYRFSGGLERKDSRVRVRAQLTEIESERVLWSERFDGDLGDVFAFQDEVTAVIAARLALQVSAAERRRALAAHAPDLRAYGLILRGQHLSLQFKREANLYARRLFEHAVEVDSRYGRSYAGLSRTFNLAWRYRWTKAPDESLDRAVELARAAIDCDALDARGFSELGFACLYKKRHDEAQAAYERAHQLNPNDADILAEMGIALTYWAKADRAVPLIRQAMRLNPYYPDRYLWYIGEAHFVLGDYQSAVDYLSKMQDNSEAHRLLAASHALLGDEQKARAHAAQVMAVHPDFSIAHWRSVQPDTDPATLERFMEGLRKAGLK